MTIKERMVTEKGGMPGHIVKEVKREVASLASMDGTS